MGTVAAPLLLVGLPAACNRAQAPGPRDFANTGSLRSALPAEI